ncbi:unnamed protein product [Rotaria sp. Silwood2]|nr:unnamed protein product [Rotaria sp. Silwood2]
MILYRTNDSEIILKSVESFVFHVGHCRFANAPIYSQHTTGDKHKFERIFRLHQILVATCFGPITYPLVSVLAFKQYSNDIVERLDSLVDDISKLCLQIKYNDPLQPCSEQIVKITPEQYSNRVKLKMDDYEDY